MVIVSNLKNPQIKSQINQVASTTKKSDSPPVTIQASKKARQLEKPMIVDEMPSLTQVKINETQTNFIRLDELEKKTIQEEQP